jgi:cell division protein FtsI/penicillin-binding protein 2
MQMAKYIAMLTNGGKQIDITLIKNVTTQVGTNIDKTEVNSYINNRLGIKNETKEEMEIKQENLKSVLEGMKSVTTETRRNSIFCI